MFTPEEFQKVKIVATIGPSSGTVDVIAAMARAGADVFRLNLSHKNREEMLANIRDIRIAEKLVGRPLAIMGDLAGPKIRIGDIDREYQVEAGRRIAIVREKCMGNDKRFCLNHPAILGSLQRGAHIFLGDGLIKLEIERITADRTIARILVGGTLKSRMGFSAQGLMMRNFTLSAKDKADIATMRKGGADAIAISFVQTVRDVRAVKKLLPANDRPMLIAKIETMSGVENAEAILQEADGIMVARGDLGFAVPIASVPHIQKYLIRIARSLAKPVITATQMLESMIYNHFPTRAEISDVANAILDGTDAVMLSGETAAGKYPVHAVEMMSEIINGATPQLKYKTYPPQNIIPDAVSHAVVTLADQVSAKLIIVFTESGATARRISRHRPKQAILVASPKPSTVHQMNFSWGTIPVLDKAAKDFSQALSKARVIALANKVVKVKKGDAFVISAGVPFGKAGTTNLALVQHI